MGYAKKLKKIVELNSTLSKQKYFKTVILKILFAEGSFFFFFTYSLVLLGESQYNTTSRQVAK